MLQIPRGTTAMITFIFVVAVVAFIPYVAAPGIVNGVKAISAQPAANAVRNLTGGVW
jgi:hypothetical protein